MEGRVLLDKEFDVAMHLTNPVAGARGEIAVVREAFADIIHLHKRYQQKEQPDGAASWIDTLKAVIAAAGRRNRYMPPNRLLMFIPRNGEDIIAPSSKSICEAQPGVFCVRPPHAHRCCWYGTPFNRTPSTA